MSSFENYQILCHEVSKTARKCGRKLEEITLVVVTKTHTWEVIQPVYLAGCRDFGENRIQEALEKIEKAPQDCHWHFIGTLQKNKVRKVVGIFKLIHSIDSLSLAQKVSDVSQELGIVSSCLFQINISKEKTKHGFAPEEFLDQMDRLTALPGLKARGLMTIAPFLEDKKLIRKTFESLRLLKDKTKLQELSMGMSHDWREAIAEGATMIRVGTAVFGTRI